jgi:hypothetical protein
VVDSLGLIKRRRGGCTHSFIAVGSSVIMQSLILQLLLSSAFAGGSSTLCCDSAAPRLSSSFLAVKPGSPLWLKVSFFLLAGLLLFMLEPNMDTIY